MSNLTQPQAEQIDGYRLLAIRPWVNLKPTGVEPVNPTTAVVFDFGRSLYVSEKPEA